jgi:prevent-host-death family protein
MVIYMTHNMVMKIVNVAEAKRRLSELLDRASKGERITIYRRNRPVAELVPLAEARPSKPRPFGLAKGQFRVPDDFDAPLSPAELADWDGGD